MESSGWREQLPPRARHPPSILLNPLNRPELLGHSSYPHAHPPGRSARLEGPPPHPPPEQVPQLPAQGLPPSLLFSASCINLDGS